MCPLCIQDKSHNSHQIAIICLEGIQNKSELKEILNKLRFITNLQEITSKKIDKFIDFPDLKKSINQTVEKIISEIRDAERQAIQKLDKISKSLKLMKRDTSTIKLFIDSSSKFLERPYKTKTYDIIKMQVDWIKDRKKTSDFINELLSLPTVERIEVEDMLKIYKCKTSIESNHKNFKKLAEELLRNSIGNFSKVRIG